MRAQRLPRPDAATALPLGLPDDLDVATELLWAEDRRELTDEVLRLTRDPDPAIRGRAALAVGRVGLPSGTTRLLELLRDPEPNVRAIAAFGLGILEPDLDPLTAAASGGRVTEGLLSLVEDPEPRVASRALWALGVNGAAAATPVVGGILRDPGPHPPEVLVAALGAWWRLPGARPGPVAPSASSDEPRVRLAAALALRRLDNPAAMLPLVPLLEDSEALVRATAARGLHEAPPSVARQHLPRLLRDDDWRVVCEALGWVAARWRAGSDVEEEILAEVIRASLHRDRHVQRRALNALALVAPAWSVPEDRLAHALEDVDRVARTAALEALGNAGEDAVGELLDEVLEAYGIDVPPADTAASAIPARLLENPLEAAALVRIIGIARRERTVAWLELLADRGPLPARAEALRQWRSIDPVRARREALEALSNGQPELIAVAAEVVELLHAEGRLAPLPEPATWTDLLWRTQLELAGEGALEPRLIVLGALLSLDPATTRRRAPALLQDDDRVIRLWALRSAPALARERPDLVAGAVAPLETARSRDDYRALASRLIDWQRQPPVLGLTTPRGEISVRLAPEWAPLTVAAFVEWAEAGFFDGIRFHRVVPNFVAQAGDPTAIGYGGAPGSLRNEETPTPYTTGTVGLALAGRDTGGSQFFIVHSPQPHLEGIYPVFGRVTDGLRIVDRLQPGDPIEVRVGG